MFMSIAKLKLNHGARKAVSRRGASMVARNRVPLAVPDLSDLAASEGRS